MLVIDKKDWLTLSDDALLAEVSEYKAALDEAQAALDEVVTYAAGRPDLKNPRIAAVLGVSERTVYNWLDRAWKRAHS